MFCPKLFLTLKNYSKEDFVADLISGCIVGVVALPLAIAFGVASGVGPTEGLVTAIIAGLIISVFGGSKVQISGPTGAFVVVIYGIIQTHGLAGLMIATIMAGVLLVVMGALKLGNVIKFVPYPVVVGFTGGIAITIFSTQINDLFGLAIQNLPGNFIDKWLCYIQNFTHINWWALGIGVVSICSIILISKISKKIPAFLVVIVVVTIITFFIKKYAGVTAIHTIGELYALPTGLPKPQIPALNLAEGETIFNLVRTLFPAAFTIAMLGAIVSLLSAMVADGITGDKHDSNTELIGQGIANIITPFFGGIPATGAVARTITNINNGGKTPIAGMVHAVVLLLILLLLGSLVGYIPMSCLAAVLVVVSYNMSGWRSFITVYKSPRADFAVLLVTFILTVIFDLTIAIEIGLLLAVVLFLKRTNETTVIRSFHNEIDPAENLDVTLHEEKLIIPEGVEVYEIDGPYFFGIANKFDEIAKVVNKAPKVRIIRMRKVSFIDSTGIHNLELLCQQSKKANIQIVLSGVNKHVHITLQKAGLIDNLGTNNVCSHIDTALERAKQQLDS